MSTRTCKNCGPLPLDQFTNELRRLCRACYNKDRRDRLAGSSIRETPTTWIDPLYLTNLITQLSDREQEVKALESTRAAEQAKIVQLELQLHNERVLSAQLSALSDRSEHVVSELEKQCEIHKTEADRYRIENEQLRMRVEDLLSPSRSVAAQSDQSELLNEVRELRTLTQNRGSEIDKLLELAKLQTAQIQDWQTERSVAAQKESKLDELILALNHLQLTELITDRSVKNQEAIKPQPSPPRVNPPKISPRVILSSS